MLIGSTSSSSTLAPACWCHLRRAQVPSLASSAAASSSSSPGHGEESSAGQPSLTVRDPGSGGLAIVHSSSALNFALFVETVAAERCNSFSFQSQLTLNTLQPHLWPRLGAVWRLQVSPARLAARHTGLPSHAATQAAREDTGARLASTGPGAGAAASGHGPQPSPLLQEAAVTSVVVRRLPGVQRLHAQPGLRPPVPRGREAEPGPAPAQLHEGGKHEVQPRPRVPAQHPVPAPPEQHAPPPPPALGVDTARPGGEPVEALQRGELRGGAPRPVPRHPHLNTKVTASMACNNI